MHREAASLEQRVENPIRELELEELQRFVKDLHKNEFESKGSVTYRELLTGAVLARFYNNHDQSPHEHPEGEKILDDDDNIIGGIRVGRILGHHEWHALEIQRSTKFWQEPKDLLVTLLACCIASLTQGWDQVANGNLGWPRGFRLNIENDGTGQDFWKVGGVNSITWFTAATLGPWLVDPLCQMSWSGRRGAVFIAALFSFAAMVGGSRTTSWQGYLVARLFLGIGIGAKASIVPIWESEILPSAKRGRLLVSWQFFTAFGIFSGSVATYIFRSNWRNQVLSGAIPAFILLIVVFLGTESPRWLILHGKYVDAFQALLRLRKDRLLALEELCYIHFLIQAERSSLYPRDGISATLNLGGRLEALSYWHRLWRIPHIPRNKRAAIATMIVMLSQQLSGIKSVINCSTLLLIVFTNILNSILGFIASIFFFSSNLRVQPPSDNKLQNTQNSYDSLRFSIGFGAANTVFSAIAYFLIEPLGKEDPLKNRLLPVERMFLGTTDTSREPPAASWTYQPSPRTRKVLKLFLGRRALLISSLGGGTVMLFVLTFLLRLDETNGAKLPLVMLFIILWTLFYSPGAGSVPFLYSAEVWPNEGRGKIICLLWLLLFLKSLDMAQTNSQKEVGMSWAVFWNFLGAGFLALFAPRGLHWGPPKLFGLFTGLSFLGMILVFFFVPGTDRANSLEDMSQKFDIRFRDFSKKRVDILIHPLRAEGSKGTPVVEHTQETHITPGIPTAKASGTPQQRELVIEDSSDSENEDLTDAIGIIHATPSVNANAGQRADSSGHSPNLGGLHETGEKVDETQKKETT